MLPVIVSKQERSTFGKPQSKREQSKFPSFREGSSKSASKTDPSNSQYIFQAAPEDDPSYRQLQLTGSVFFWGDPFLDVFSRETKGQQHRFWGSNQEDTPNFEVKIRPLASREKAGLAPNPDPNQSAAGCPAVNFTSLPIAEVAGTQ